jgi:O-acetyl-ADP-ribose deacetylase (regulator of RNase III)
LHFHLFRRELTAIQESEAAKVASVAIKNFVTADEQVEEVRLVFFQQRDARVFLEYQEFE